MVLRARRGPALAAVALLAVVLILLGARPAMAWVDVHVEGDDVRLSLDSSGRARVEHRITLKITGGPMRSLELVPPGTPKEADASAPVSVLRVRFQSNRGIGRGVYVLLVRYGTSLSDR